MDESLWERVSAGDRRALAKALSVVEDDRPGASELLRRAHRPGGGHRIGVTGAPGAGKSTLADRLVALLRDDGEVAVLAVDPTSPFSGGAILGDRVRMQDHITDPGVFIRSMASRGHLGGLSAAAPRALAVLEAAGFPWLLVETVGVGQDEVEVASATDTVLVVVNPGWGDAIQAAKAGILEIGDVFVVNKADRPGAEEAMSDLQTMLHQGAERVWTPPVIATVASVGDGVADVAAAVHRHRDHLADSGEGAERTRRRHRHELETALAAEFRARALAVAAGAPDVVAAVESGDLDPWTAAVELLGTDR